MLISAKNLKRDSSVITNILGCVAPQDQGVKTKLQNVYFCFEGSRSARNYRFIAALTLALVWSVVPGLSAEWSTLIGPDPSRYCVLIGSTYLP